MTLPRLLAAAIVLVPTVALADDDYGGDYYAGPSATPPTVAAPQPAPPPPPEFRSRWSIGFALGGASFAPEGNPDAKADFDLGQLAVRYRGWRHLELELAMAGGTQQLPEERRDLDAAYEIAQVTLAAKYRFNVQNHWNWWLMAGVGSTTIAPEGAGEEQRTASERPHGLLGIGLEYRWTKFAIQAEAKAIKLGQTDDEQALEDATGEKMPEIGGGSFTLGGAFYF
ncbi:MAG: hypothetical protein JNL83_02920 [Myxococcales bacterium]|nr:hypothetical protein [Myxococcales bacterium]